MAKADQKPLPNLDVAKETAEEERASEFLYGVVQEIESGPTALMFSRLRAASQRQAEIWETRLREAGVTPLEFRPRWRHHLVVWIVRTFGVRRSLPILAAMKVRGLAIYRDGQFATVPPQEASAPDTESWHRASRGGGALRAAVFGVNDGLVSNAGLIMAMAGAGSSPETILIAGTAGLLAGGFSMAAGEYVSVRTQRELFEHQIAIEWNEIRTMPEEEIAELAVIYEAKGLSADEALTVAKRLLADPQRGLDTLAREELGLDPAGLASPTAAAVSSFASFAGGAFVPLIPNFFMTGDTAVLTSLAAMELGLLGVGALMSLFTGQSAAWSAGRMALIGTAAAAGTFAIGRFFGLAIG